MTLQSGERHGIPHWANRKKALPRKLSKAKNVSNTLRHSVPVFDEPLVNYMVGVRETLVDPAASLPQTFPRVFEQRDILLDDLRVQRETEARQKTEPVILAVQNETQRLSIKPTHDMTRPQYQIGDTVIARVVQRYQNVSFLSSLAALMKTKKDSIKTDIILGLTDAEFVKIPVSSMLESFQLPSTTKQPGCDEDFGHALICL